MQYQSTSKASSTSIVRIDNIEHTATATATATATGSTLEEAKQNSEELAAQKALAEVNRIVDNIYTYKYRR